MSVFVYSDHMGKVECPTNGKSLTVECEDKQRLGEESWNVEEMVGGDLGYLLGEVFRELMVPGQYIGLLFLNLWHK